MTTHREQSTFSCRDQTATSPMSPEGTHGGPERRGSDASADMGDLKPGLLVLIG